MGTLIIEDYSGIPSINGYPCTYTTIDIETYVEGRFKTDKTFELPEGYTITLIPSKFWGKVAKVDYNKPINAEQNKKTDILNIQTALSYGNQCMSSHITNDHRRKWSELSIKASEALQNIINTIH